MKNLVPINKHTGRFARDNTIQRMFYQNQFCNHELTWLDRDTGEELYGYAFIHTDNNTGACFARNMSILRKLESIGEIKLPRTDPMVNLRFSFQLIPEDKKAHFEAFQILQDPDARSCAGLPLGGCVFE